MALSVTVLPLMHKSLLDAILYNRAGRQNQRKGRGESVPAPMRQGGRLMTIEIQDRVGPFGETARGVSNHVHSFAGTFPLSPPGRSVCFSKVREYCAS